MWMEGTWRKADGALVQVPCAGCLPALFALVSTLPLGQQPGGPSLMGRGVLDGTPLLGSSENPFGSPVGRLN